jgi:galactitol-specific phosphotransferase system IIC component
VGWTKVGAVQIFIPKTTLLQGQLSGCFILPFVELAVISIAVRRHVTIWVSRQQLLAAI